LYKIPATTLFLGKNLIFMEECQSTNDHLLLLCQKEHLSEGSLVVTSNQTAGRGQRGNTWQTQPGLNLTFSFLLRPGFLSVQDQFYLNIFVSLGIADYLTSEAPGKVQIKWPNDILVNERKACGVLIENQISGTRLALTVVGVGLNVNQKEFSVPHATSLAIGTGRNYELASVLPVLLQHIEVRYLQLKERKLESLRESYLANLFKRNQPYTFYTADVEFEGEIVGIDEIGRLLVKGPAGTRSFDIREIRYGTFR
jgi:BirA family transcriptional regulator, biotin operon repressor / biotin---[acetyl-CoA-carboxylase] ligase